MLVVAVCVLDITNTLHPCAEVRRCTDDSSIGQPVVTGPVPVTQMEDAHRPYQTAHTRYAETPLS